ncbi:MULTISPECIES: hypothetical protein [unclassified Prochlorococcus]|uniref:GHMP family kinase ATP-binding protein n=1 Tax=unclassified Prochlorococcus TaxID=2627481 RepID=UPI00053370AF|nr:MULTISPECIES: hypothetical protein [unclassified Prochlorococcus]KGG16347.1 D,D-heptose 7-phosphate kinase [Prochlorococcus sp. MIT 0603]KGG17919.1 D,D-heptose 7-phosphate kinase [Prochlorococcus sp. MIT 0602]
MIITRAPFRVSFFGGGTDHESWYKNNGAVVIGTTINSFCYVTLRPLTPFYGTRFRLSWSKIEEVKDPSEIDHPAVRGALNHFKIKQGLEIHTDGDLPARSGLGSSSSFSSALILGLNTYLGKKVSIRELTESTINFEQNILKENVGIQDQIQACQGGFSLINIREDGLYRTLRLDISDELVRKISQEMLLLYTGISRTSSDIHNANKNLDQQIKDESLKQICRIAKKVNSKILDGEMKYEDFCSYLRESWLHKSSSFPRSKLSENLLSIYEEAISAGAHSGKLLGAGGGGFYLFLVPKEKQNRFNEAMKSYKINDPEITNEGCSILYKD